ncbi:acetyltransferase [Actinomycetes bacterium]|nr:acetyltransferase [Actinomycetes bacterium]
MRLRPLSLADEKQALQGHAELATENWEYLLGYTENLPWAEYVEALNDESLGRNLKEGRVPATFLMAEREGILIGRASIRHELNDFLFNYGGHIGYGVRPKYRRRGFAIEILRQSLTYLNGLGVSEVLITCDEDNVGSIRVIESQGGILENTMEFEGILKRRYWISRVIL